MIKKFHITNVFLSFAVLFSILFQAIHAYEHHLEALTEKHCDHQYSTNKTEISHAHKVAENCVVCHFNFSSFTTTEFYEFQFHKNIHVTHSPLFYFQKQAAFFKGSLFSLRAPPLV